MEFRRMRVGLLCLLLDGDGLSGLRKGRQNFAE